MDVSAWKKHVECEICLFGRNGTGPLLFIPFVKTRKSRFLLISVVIMLEQDLDGTFEIDTDVHYPERSSGERRRRRRLIHSKETAFV